MYNSDMKNYESLIFDSEETFMIHSPTCHNVTATGTDLMCPDVALIKTYQVNGLRGDIIHAISPLGGFQATKWCFDFLLCYNSSGLLIRFVVLHFNLSVVFEGQNFAHWFANHGYTITPSA